MTDVRAVMDAAAVERAVVMGANEGSMMAALFAATYQAGERSRPRERDGPAGLGAGQPGRSPPRVIEAIIETVDQAWGQQHHASCPVNPASIAGDDEATQRWGRFLGLTASPRSPPR